MAKRPTHSWTVFGLAVKKAADGYEVTDVREIGVVDLPSRATNSEIVTELRAVGFLDRRATTRTVEVEKESGMLFVSRKSDGFPLLNVERS